MDPKLGEPSKFIAASEKIETKENEDNRKFYQTKTLGVKSTDNPLMLKSISELKTQYYKTKELIATVNLDSLPDKGDKIKFNLANLKKCILKKYEQHELLKRVENLDLKDKQANSTQIKLPPKIVTDKVSKWDHVLSENKDAYNVFDEIKKNQKMDSDPVDQSNLNTILMEHQIDAIRWMKCRESFKPYGGILADDMGLGKTLMILAFISQHPNQQNLVITPTSVLHQWKYEIEKHLKHMPHLIYHGQDREKREFDIRNARIVLTTYGTCTSKNSDIIYQTKWTRVVVDEAHNIRNYKTKLFASIDKLEASIFNLYFEYKWGLTGTPIQNSLNDFYSLIRFLHFQPFDDYRFWVNSVQKHSERQHHISQLVQTLVLRRTKNQLNSKNEPIVKLPPKSEQTYYLELSNIEKTDYQSIREKLVNNVRAYFSSQSKDPVEISYGHVLVNLLRLQQACCHPYLLQQNIKSTEPDLEADEIDQLTKQFESLIIHSSESQYHQDFESTKIKEMLKIISSEMENNSKSKLYFCSSISVIVSQWTSFLRIINHHIKKLTFTFDTISGSVSAYDRQSIVYRFNEKQHPQILFLSLKAGGVGLNLVGANNLIIMDQHWNPALENQATDRIYRVGQKNPIKIHKFLVRDTVEHHIVKLKHKKQQLANDILTTSTTKVSKLTKDDVKYLLDIK